MNVKKFLGILLIFPFLLSGCYDYRAIEELGIVTALGYDIEKGKNISYEDTSETLLFKGSKQITHDVITGKSNTIFTTEHDLQSKSSKKWVLGGEIAYIVSEERAKFGLKDLIDGLMRNIIRRQTAVIVVSKQNAKDVLNTNPHTFNTISEELNSNLQHGYIENFISKNDHVYNFLSMYYMEGSKIVIPYIEVDKDRIRYAGLALFDNDKMLKSVPLDEARLINLLRNDKCMGTIGINTQNKNEYYDLICKCKRKIKVSEENAHVKYDVLLNISAELVTDSVDKNPIGSDEASKISELLSKKLTNDLNEEVKKMQTEYEMDWFDFGKYAIAKLGRNKGYGSDEAFCKAKINIHVNTKLSTLGRAEK